MFQLASFGTDVTCPIGSRCMGILPTKAKEIVDPLYAHGFVLLGAGEPIVLVSVDWCEIRNDAYDRWREVLAAAAGTKPERVIVSSIHQHDAPVADIGAENWLARVGLAGEMLDVRWHEEVVQRVAEAMRDSLKAPKRVTHIGTGQAKVEKVSSTRRVVLPDGSVTFGRGSSSGGNATYREAPEGDIDPWLKTLSFWDGEKPLLAMHTYAVHPMSYYGRGGVSADFPGMARDRRQRDDAGVHQIYFSGASGDVTAGKYNDGSPANRPLLAHRLYEAMVAAWKETTRHPLAEVTFRNTSYELPFREGEAYATQALLARLEDDKATIANRILAAMALSSRRRLTAGKKIDMPCVDFGPAQVLLLPGEVFVGYQLMAQKLRPDSFVVALGYGECWPGYVPTESGFDEGFEDVWLWVARGSEARLRDAMQRVLSARST